MLKVNKKVEYALMALKYMSEKNDGELTTAREICEKFDLPFDPVSKVLQGLNASSIVTSIKGVKGGYTLSKDLDTITYMDLYSIIEGKNHSSHCGQHDDACERKDQCNIKDSMNSLNHNLSEYLQQITLKDLLTNKKFAGAKS